MSYKAGRSRVTRALHTKVNDEVARPVVTPLFQNSAFCADSPYFYTRKNNPNCEELETVVAELEGAPHALSVTTGMAAVNIVASILKPSDTLVLNKYVYGCSHRFFTRLSQQRDIRLVFLDLSSPEGIAEIPSSVSMVFFETPTNPFLKTVNISQVSSHVKELNPQASVIVDNTWATPLFQQPLLHGADVSLHSATKFLSGHSDVMGGIVLTSSASFAEKLRAERFYTGAILDPHSAWLLRRSLQTFDIRMQRHESSTRELAEFLRQQPQIERLYYPNIDGDQLTGYGGILFFQLRQDLARLYESFSGALQLFDTGTGMACVTSMVAQPYTGSHTSMDDSEKEQIGLDRGLVRLCFGMEDVGDLRQDILQALDAIEGLR